MQNLSGTGAHKGEWKQSCELQQTGFAIEVFKTQEAKG